MSRQNHNLKHHHQQPIYYSAEFHSITDLCGAYHEGLSHTQKNPIKH